MKKQFKLKIYFRSNKKPLSINSTSEKMLERIKEELVIKMDDSNNVVDLPQFNIALSKRDISYIILK